MTIKKLTDFDLVENFLQNNFSSPTHFPEWNLLVSRIYGSNFYYLGAYHKNLLIGICPIHEEKRGILKNLYSGQYHYIPNGGWIFNQNISSNKFSKYLAFSSLQIFCLPQVNEFNSNQINPYKIFYTLVIDLRKDIEIIWLRDINSKRRNMIRKAEKNDILVKINPKDSLNEFYEHYVSFNNLRKLQYLPLDFFLRAQLFSKIKIDYFVAYTNNSISNYLLTVSDKNYSFYWLGININGFNTLGQSELLQWKAIKYLKEKQCSYYDLCYVEKERLPNIYEFKRGFSQTEVSIPFIKFTGIGYKLCNRILK